MVVGVMRIDIRLFEVHSLKQKRSQISRLLNRLRAKFPVSIAEVGLQDLHQRSLLGASICAGNEQLVQSVFKNLEKEIYSAGLVEIIDLDIEYLHYGEDIR
ncbi:MAG: DUF503 domain-containing protein [Deltaproteobacteria bacterium]|jgi:uncharacterized protein YlxP (DUF503 family)|nr:DUF503 domain-containing protein [Deltaproteobacteria bacterium]MCW8893491.1 DUF503 domain-containing protein [Deltaproteobacteria bacterium]MCW9050403.1 DUF503 domain-containing protein [Deltaproteobacteria bacterium]